MLTDIDFYVNDYGGEVHASQGEKGLKKLLRRAERDVWCVCSDEACGAFGGKEIDGGIAEILKTAVCVQADFLAEISGDDNIGSDENDAGNADSPNENTPNEGTLNEGTGGEDMTGECAASQVVSSVKLGDFSVNYDYISSSAKSGGSEKAESSGSGKADSGSSEKSGGESEKSEKESGSAVIGCARGNVCGEALLILDKGGVLYRGGVRL